MIKAILFLAFIVSLNAKNITYVKMCVDPDWMPMESIDTNGNHIGVVADVLSIIETKTNFKFILVPTKSWAESILFIKQNKCDILPLVSATEDRKKWLNFTPSYINYPEGLVVRASEDRKSLEEILKLPVGITKRYASIVWFKNKFPDINIIEVDNIDDAFAKLRNREIYSYSDILPTVGYKLQKENILDLKISYAFGKDSYTFNAGMAVIKGKDELHNQLSNAINSLNEKKLNAILEKWMRINTGDIAKHPPIYQIIGVVLLLIGIVLYWNYKLRLTIKLKTKDIEESTSKLKELNDKLENEVKAKQKK